jgi:ADP-ribose pyrophosphatase
MDILGTRKITDEKWLNLYAVEFRHNDHVGRWVYASRRARPGSPTPHADAVVIAALVRDPAAETRVAVLREFRIPCGGTIYGLPAGLVDDGEAVESAVRRELAEETGLELIAVRRVSPPIFSSCGMTDEAVAVVFADVRQVPGGRPHLEASEEAECLLLDHAGVCRLLDDPSARFDAKAWFVLDLYRTLGRFE